MTRKRVAILDIDGTLVDSNDAHARVWADTLREFGHQVPPERFRDLIGKGGDKVLPETTGIDDESEEAQAMKKRRGELFKEKYLPTITAFPAVRDLLLRMRASGLDLVIATSAQESEVHDLLEVAGVTDLISKAASSGDAKNSKPDPDIVLAALTRSGCSAGEAVMLGDTPYDVQAARRARISVVALRCGGWHDEALKGAAAIYDGPNDLLTKFSTSPFMLV